MSRFQVLSDAQWSLIEDALPRATGRRGRPFADARTMVKAIVYRYRTGTAWRDLPPTYGPWQTVWTWHRRMAGNGTWDTVMTLLTRQADAAGGIRLVGLGGLHDRSRASARHEHHAPRGGAGSNYTNPPETLIEPPDHAFGRSRGACRPRSEPPRQVRRLRSLGRMESCQGVRRRGTRPSCVSGRSGWSPRSGPSTSRSGRR